MTYLVITTNKYHFKSSCIVPDTWWRRRRKRPSDLFYVGTPSAAVICRLPLIYFCSSETQDKEFGVTMNQVALSWYAICRERWDVNTVPALGTIWCDSSKQGCKNSRDFLLMVSLGTPLSSFKVLQLSWRERLTCNQAKLRLFQLSLGFWGQGGLFNCPLPTEWLQWWSCHILKECRDFILLLFADSDPASLKPVGAEAIVRFSESLTNHWSHLKSSSPFSHLFNSLPLSTPNHSTGVLYLEEVRGA